MAMIAVSDILIEAKEKPSKKSKQGGATGSVAVVCLKILIREGVFCVRKVGIQSHR